MVWTMYWIQRYEHIPLRLSVIFLVYFYMVTFYSTCCRLEHSSSAVECWTRNQESPSLNPPLLVATVSKIDHFCSLHDASVDSAV